MTLRLWSLLRPHQAQDPKDVGVVTAYALA